MSKQTPLMPFLTKREGRSQHVLLLLRLCRGEAEVFSAYVSTAASRFLWLCPHPSRRNPMSLVNRSNRYARYEAVRTLHQQAFSQREIARRLKLSRQTVQRFLVAETAPPRSRPPYRGSILDPYKPYILERWQSGCWNGTQLYSEVKMCGYTGSDSLFRLFISQLRKQHQRVGTASILTLDSSGAHVKAPLDSPPKPSPKRRMSPTRASWLCVCQPDKLDEKQRQHVEQIRAAHRDLDTAYQLSQAFVTMPSRAS